MIFSDFLREVKQTCTETQKGLSNPRQIWQCLDVNLNLQKWGFCSLPLLTLDIQSPGLGI